MRRPSAVVAWSQIHWERKQEDWINPATGIITSSCGTRINPVLDRQELHNGIDIAVSMGTEVVAVRSGVVSEVRRSPTFGLLVKYKTEDEFEIMYAHLSEVLVKIGDEVTQGQAIAKSGNSGLSTGPHLHYSVWKEGELIDPIQFVSLTFTKEVEQEYAARGDFI